MASGSPPESNASLASSRTGSGGHETSSFSSLCPLPATYLKLRLPEYPVSGLLGEKGTRNLKQELSSRATRGLTEEEWEVGPSTESKSTAVAFGSGACEFNGGREREDEGGLKKNKVEEDEAARERERKIVNLIEKEGRPISFLSELLPSTLMKS